MLKLLAALHVSSLVEHCAQIRQGCRLHTAALLALPSATAYLRLGFLFTLSMMLRRYLRTRIKHGSQDAEVEGGRANVKHRRAGTSLVSRAAGDVTQSHWDLSGTEQACKGIQSPQASCLAVLSLRYPLPPAWRSGLSLLSFHSCGRKPRAWLTAEA